MVGTLRSRSYPALMAAVLAAVAPWIAWAPPAPAAEAATAPARDTVLTLPEVEVERERFTDIERRLPTAFATDLRFGASARALETVADVLGEAAGVRIVRFGGLGAFTTVSIRGASPGHVAVYLDGVPLTSADQSVVNLSDLPASAIERVEVYRGLSPLALGPATPGGAINLVTLAKPGLREVQLMRGSFGTWEGRATLASEAGPLSGLIHVGYQGSDGDFRFPDDNGTPFNALDDSMTTRANNRFDATTVHATLGWQINRMWHARVRQNLFHKAQGVPGIGVAPALHPRLTLARSITQVELERDDLGALPRVRLSAAVQRTHSRFRDTQGELGPGSYDTDDRLGDDGATLNVEWPHLPLGLAVEGTGALRSEHARLRDEVTVFADPPPSRRRTAAAGAGVNLALGSRVLLHAARRWDRIEDHLHSVGVGGLAETRDVARVLDSPQLGASLAGPFGLELRGNWADATRAPEFLELFGNSGSVLGNPKLVPERAENWDAGARWKTPLAGRLRASAEWAHFESWARDLIVYVRNSQSSVKAQNVSRASISGDEVAGHIEWKRDRRVRVALTATFTWQSAIDRGPVPFWNGKRLPQRPARQAYARLEATLGRWTASAAVHDMGENYLDRYNRYRVSGRTLVGASVSHALRSDRLRVTVEGKNLGDNQVSDLGGFPLPGRSIFVSLQARLAPGS